MMHGRMIGLFVFGVGGMLLTHGFLPGLAIVLIFLGAFQNLRSA